VKIFFDTSVLVAALVEGHPHHARSFASLKRALGNGNEFLVSSHTLAELYAVLTALPVSPRISPGMAGRLIEESVFRRARVIALSVTDYLTVLRRAADSALAGGNIYDALIFMAAEKAGAECLLTLNPADFQRAGPGENGFLQTP